MYLQKHTDKSFYDPTGLPGQNHRRFIDPEWLGPLRSGGSSNCSAAKGA